MSIITAGNLIDKVAVALFDVTNVEWSRTEMLAHLNQAQRLIATLQPSAMATTANILTAIGSKQSVPSVGWMLLDVVRNMGISGSAPGYAITTASRKLLDAYVPNWNAAGSSAVTRNYIYDPQSPRQFYIYPPSLGTHYIEITYAAVPADIASEATVITLSDAYEDALVNFMLFKAYAKNAPYVPATKAPEHLALFNLAINGKITAEQANNPNLALFPPTPQATGGVV